MLALTDFYIYSATSKSADRMIDAIYLDGLIPYQNHPAYELTRSLSAAEANGKSVNEIFSRFLT